MVVLIDTNVIMDDLVTREAFFKKYEYSIYYTSAPFISM